MAGAKYYVWASGAWREVQASGRVAGWQRRARFLFVRRGRLQLAPRGVLRALAAHAAGQPSAVRDGPRLSQRSYVHGYKASKAPATSDRTRCQNAHNRSKGGAAAARGPPAAAARTADCSTQCSAQASPAPAHTRALTLNIHTQRTHTSDDDFQTKPTLKPGPRTQSERRARAAAETRAPAARAPSASSSESLIHFVTKKTVANIENIPEKNDKTPTKNKILRRSSEDSEVTFDNNKHSLKSPVKTKTVARNTKVNLGERLNSETSDDGVKVIYDRAKSKRNRSRKTRRQATDDEPGPKRPKIDKEQASSPYKKSNPTSMSRKQIIENLSDTSESDTEAKAKDISSDSEIIAKVSQRAVAQHAAGTGSSSGDVAAAGGRARCLELVVPERDVALLREYIARERCADLHRFDTCDHYKTGLFYSINPVVDIERCARMERALRDHALERFAKGLGLRSVSEVSTQPSIYKRRKRIGNNSSKASSDGDSVESVEENRSQEGSGRLHTDKRKNESNKLNVEKSAHAIDGPQDESKKLALRRDRTKKINNKTNALRSELSRDHSIDIDRTKRLANKTSVNDAKKTKDTSKNKSRELTKNVSKNNKTTEHTSECNSSTSEDTTKKQTKALTNKLSLHRSENRDSDTTRHPNKSKNKKSANKPSTHQPESTRDSSSENITTEVTKDKTSRTNKRTDNSSESTRDRSEHTEYRTSRSHTKKLAKKLSHNESIHIRDSSEDNRMEANKSRTKQSSKKPHAHKSTRDRPEDNSKTIKSSKKMSTHRSHTTRDSSEDSEDITNRSHTEQLTRKSKTKKPSNKPIARESEFSGESSSEDEAIELSKDRISRTKKSSKLSVHRSESSRDSSEDTEEITSRSHTKQLTTKSRNKKSLNRPNANAHDSESTGDSSEDEDSRRKTKKLKYKPNSREAGATESSDTSKQHDRITIKKSTNKPRAHRVEIISESSEDTSEELTEDGLTKEKSKSSRKPGAAESSAEFKENVPRRANRPRGAGDDSGGGGGEPAPSRAALQRAARSPHTISKRPSAWAANEYSNLEDHAIVAWLSAGGGGRAGRVNGNAVWRELQEQYPALAGRARSFHSLRNRYLRYILPALGALRLPPAHAARLRAAAAAGARKRAHRPPRRNSIFDREPPARAAASRRPRPARSPPPAPPPPPAPAPVADEDAPPASPRRRSLRSSGAAPAPAPAARSPRYSDVTRQFASRKLRSTPRSSVTSPRDPPPPPSPAHPAPPATRTRRLFNPNKLL